MFSQNSAAAQWKFIVEGRIYGPVNTDKIRELCCGGVIQHQTQVSSTLFDGWVQAGSVGALRSMIQTTPRAGSAEEALRGIPSNVDGSSAAFNEKPPYSAALVGLLVVSGAVGALKWLNDRTVTDASMRISFAIGAALTVFVIGCIVGWMLSLAGWLFKAHRRQMATVGFACGAGIIALASLVHEFGAAQKKVEIVRRDEKAKQELQNELKSLTTQVRTELEVQEQEPAEVAPTTRPSPLTGKPTLPAIKVQPDATEGERLSAISRQIMRDIMQQRTTYLGEIRELHLDLALLPTRLLKALGRADGRQRCAAARESLATYESNIKNLLADVPARVRKSGVSEASYRSFMAGFQTTLPKSQLAIQRVLSLENAALDEMESIFDLVDAHSGQIALKDGQLVFARQQDLNAFRQSAQRLTMIAREEQKMQQQSLDHMASISGD